MHGRDQGRGDAVVRRIRDAGGHAIFVAADLSEDAACAELVDTAAAVLGGLTVLVNNAVASSVDDADGPVTEHQPPGVGAQPAGQPDRADVARAGARSRT